jgi:hypothetical protein
MKGLIVAFLMFIFFCGTAFADCEGEIWKVCQTTYKGKTYQIVTSSGCNNVKKAAILSDYNSLNEALIASRWLNVMAYMMCKQQRAVEPLNEALENAEWKEVK